MNAVIKKIERKVCALYNAKPCRLVSGRSVISFTFDDVPSSAVSEGAKILEKHNIGGTFYLSGSLADQENLGLPQYAPQDIKSLLDGGHEIGCHTYGHINVLNAKKATIELDLGQNFEFLKPYIGDHDLTGFSYPYGCASITAKHIMRRRFAVSRGIAPGLNTGIADLSQLKANNLYNSTMNVEKIDALIYQVVKDGGWLIFYTHDISDTPTNVGCTAELLDYAVSKAAAAPSCEVLCMRSALARLSFE